MALPTLPERAYAEGAQAALAKLGFASAVAAGVRGLGTAIGSKLPGLMSGAKSLGSKAMGVMSHPVTNAAMVGVPAAATIASAKTPTVGNLKKVV